MIEITIKKKITESRKQTTNFQVTSKPTGFKKLKNDYGGGTTEEVCFETTYAPSEVTEYKDVERVLLTQQIDDESKFDLAAVIVAVNKLG